MLIFHHWDKNTLHKQLKEGSILAHSTRSFSPEFPNSIASEPVVVRTLKQRALHKTNDSSHHKLETERKTQTVRINMYTSMRGHWDLLLQTMPPLLNRVLN